MYYQSHAFGKYCSLRNTWQPAIQKKMTPKTIFKDLNRALIKRLELLPNVFEFETEKYSIHEFAAIYGIEKILRRTQAEKLLVSRPNRYLTRQYHRLTQYAANNQVMEFNKLSETIIRKSISYRILSLNRTISDWHILPIRTLRRIWRSLSFISRTLSSDLKFKRVWIDKKPGDYARPLGVPTPAWRCYSFMWMDHIERFFKASGKLASWQHGGRSGVGVLSCYKSLIPRIVKGPSSAKFIYEFDIKGFFDNINHESIITKFKENMFANSPTANWITQILGAEPEKYTLPPITADKAAQRYEEMKLGLHLDDEPWTRSLDSTDFGFIEYPGTWDELYEYLKDNNIPEAFWNNYVTVEEVDAWDATEAKFKALNLKAQYKDLMNQPQTVTRRLPGSITGIKPMEDYSEKDRAQGRDAWKNLGQPGKGVPQGLNTSPFISTVMTDSVFYDLGLWNAIIMYMDDGLLFAETRADLERNILLLKEGLKSLGLEMEISKSGLVKEDGKWLKSMKFLGLRYLPEEDTLMSDTRSGTQVKFPAHAEWDDIKLMAAQNNLSTPYMRKKFDKLINTQAYEAGLKYGFLGCLIAGSQYKEALTMVERKEEISKGQSSAWARITESKGYVWKHQDLMNFPETLTNVSSIASHRFAESNRLGYKLHIHKGGKVRRGSRVQRALA